MPNNLEAFIVRLPRQLHAKIKSNAQAERRSMNKEIVVRLDRSFVESQAYTTDIKIQKLMLDRIDLLEAQIELLKAELAAKQ